MIIYADEYQTLNYLTSKSLLEVQWSQASSQLRQQNYRSKLLNLAYYLKYSKPKKVLANLENLTYKGEFDFKPHFYKFINTVISKNGIGKIALVKSGDMITQIVIDDLLRHLKPETIEFQLFDTYEKAQSWLNKDLQMAS